MGIVFACVGAGSASAMGGVKDDCAPAGRWLDPSTGDLLGHETLIADLSKRSVVMLGESHPNVEHHRWQLQVLAALHGRNSNMVLGFESFPRSAQPVLDRWIRGDLSEAEFLKQSKWNDVWRFDSGLYMPLFHFARQNRLPMIALNVDRALVSRVAKEGWASIPMAEREGVGDPAAAAGAYIDVLAEIHAAHKQAEKNPPHGHGAPKPASETKVEPIDRESPEFKRFVEAQLTWDRSMAEALAGARTAGGEPLVVGIAGQGHLEYGDGIPHQLRDLGIKGAAVLLPWDPGQSCSEMKAADVLIADAVFRVDSPAPTVRLAGPVLGIMLKHGQAKGDPVLVTRVSEGSVAAAAGLAKGDIVLQAAQRPVSSNASLVAIIRRQAPGTWLPLKIKRGEEVLEIIAKFPPVP